MSGCNVALALVSRASPPPPPPQTIWRFLLIFQKHERGLIVMVVVVDPKAQLGRVGRIFSGALEALVLQRHRPDDFCFSRDQRNNPSASFV